MKRTFRIPHLFRRFSTTLLLWALLAALLLVATTVVAFDRYQARWNVTKTDSESLIVRRAHADDHLIGDISAPVQVVVYADLSCSPCKDFFVDTLPRLQATYGDSIVVAYRHRLFPSSHDGRVEASAAECVNQLGGNDAFWRFVYAVYSEPGYTEGISLLDLASVADRIGISRARMSACVGSGAHDSRIKADALEASIAGISQAPGIVLKSATRALIVKGNYYSQLDTGINYLLQAGL